MTSGAMYIGDPHKVAAITPSCKNLANPKSAEKETIIGINRYIFNLKEFTNLLKEINKINGQVNLIIIKIKD